MPRYLTSHNMACMTKQGARALAEQMRAATAVQFLRLVVNMTDGQMIGEFEAASRDVMEGWMKQSGIHFEWLRRIDFEATREEFRDL